MKTGAGIFPTIFWLIKQNQPDAKTGAIYRWSDFGRLFEKSAADVDMTFDSEEATIGDAVKYIQEDQPTFLFVHLDYVDGADHKYGHSTREYYASMPKADQLIGEVVDALVSSGIMEKTLIIISADHGVIGTSHGGENLEEVEIPIILFGAEIKGALS